MDTMNITNEAGFSIEVRLPTPIGWKVLVRPLQAPKKSKGGIMLTDETTRAEQSFVYIGQILAMGDASFLATTQGGINMRDMRNPDVGDWVVYAPFAGQKIRVRGDDSLLLLLNDTEIQAIVDKPEQFYAVIDA